MINKQSIFAQSGQLQPSYSDANYREGMKPQTIAYAEDVNSFGNTMDTALTAVCKEVAKVITDNGIALNANDNTQLSTVFDTKMQSGYMMTGVNYDGATFTNPTQNGNSISFPAMNVVYNKKVYYGNTKSDFEVKTTNPSTISATSGWANGIYYFYATGSNIAYTDRPVPASEGNSRCYLGSAFVYDGAFQEGSFKFQPWLRITSQAMRESPTAETKGGFISPNGINQLRMGALEIKDEGINFDVDPNNPNIMKVAATEAMSYKFLRPGYDPSEQGTTILDTSHIYNLTTGTWDDISEVENKFMVLVPCITPSAQTLFIPAMSERVGTNYTQLFDSVEEATSAIYGLQYTDSSVDKSRQRVIYFGFSIVVKVNATNLSDANQFAIVGMVPQQLSGFTSAGGQTGGGTGAYIPMKEETFPSAETDITLINNASNVIVGHATSSRNIHFPTAKAGIVNQLEVKFTKSNGVLPIVFPADVKWWSGAPVFEDGVTYLIICEYINSNWYAGYLSV